MKLVNVFNGAFHPMKRVGPYSKLVGELTLDGREWTLERRVEIEADEAVLIGAPKVSVLYGNGLEDVKLSIKLDDEKVLDRAPLVKAHEQIQYNFETLGCFYLALGNDEPIWNAGSQDPIPPGGVFVTHGAFFHATVSTPRGIPGAPRIRILLRAELYRKAR
jgi:hypothetical protein